MKVKELIYKLKNLNRNAVVCQVFSSEYARIVTEIDSVAPNSKGDFVVLWNDYGEGFGQEIKGLKK